MDTLIATTAIHHHHWVIAEPNGHLSIGVCKLCREVRVFQNWLAETDFIGTEESRSLTGSSQGSAWKRFQPDRAG